LEVLKWVLIVLAAGFVGQFGKRLADHLIARSRRRRAAKLPSQIAQPPQAQTRLGDFPPAVEKSASKAIKKSAKAEVKRNKKASG
jgi:hypothetical protein